MKSPTPQQREAIQFLQRQREQWEHLLTWLKENVRQAQHDCVRAENEIDVRRLQGKAQLAIWLMDILTPKPD